MAESIGQSPNPLDPSSSEGEQQPTLPPMPAAAPQDTGAGAPGVGGSEPPPAPPPVWAEPLPGAGPSAPGTGWGEQPPPPRRRTALIAVLIAAGVVLLLAIAAVVLWLTGVLSLLFGGPVAATIAPTNTDLYLSINMNLESLPGYKHLADVYGDVPSVKESTDGLQTGLEELGLSFENDIKPWIGREVGIALTNLGASEAGLPVTNLGAAGSSPLAATQDVAIIASSRNTRASGAFLDKLQSTLPGQGYTVEKKDFAGVTYYQATRRTASPMFFGAVKSFVVLATTESSMQGVINVAQGKADALAKNEHYKELVKLLPANAVGYFLFPNLQGLMDSYLKNLGLDAVSGSVVGQTEAYESMGMAAVLEDDGVRIEFAFKLDPAALTPEMKAATSNQPSAERILKWIPADALGFISSQDLAGGWKRALATLKETPDMEESLQQLGEPLNLTIDEDLFSWAPGEYAIAVVETAGASGIGGYVVIEVSDQSKAADVLDKVATAIEQNADAQFQDKDIGGHKMRMLADPASDQAIGYGFAGEHLFIGILGSVLEKVVPGDFATVADDKTFQAVRAHLPAQRTMNLYINVNAVVRLVLQGLPAGDSTRAMLEPIQAIGVAGAPFDARTGAVRATLFVYIP